MLILHDFTSICDEHTGRPGFEGSLHIATNETEFLQENDVIGLLLDLDRGIIKCYENGRYKETVDEGVAGHYCWMTMISRTDNDRGAVIERKPVPPE